MNVILDWHKHGVRVVDATDLDRAALHVLRRRRSEGPSTGERVELVEAEQPR
jgi:hypothetical protein